MRVLRLALPALAAAGLTSPAASQSVRGPSAEELVEMTDLSGLAASPDGRWVAVRTEQPDIRNNDVQLSWWVVPIDGSSGPTRIADGGAPLWTGAGTILSEPAVWSPDSQHFYFRRLDEDGVQVWAASPASGSMRQITSDAGDVIRFRLVDDGRALVYEVEGADRAEIIAAEQREYESGIRIDSSVDVAQNLYRTVEINGRLASERLHGNWFGRTHVLGSRPPRLRRLSIVGGSGSPAAEQGNFDRTEPGLGPEDRVTGRRIDGRAIALIRGWGRATELHWAPSDAPQKTTRCDKPECRSVVAAAWRGATPEIVFVARQPNQSDGLFIWDTRANTVRGLAEVQSLTTEAGDGCAITQSAALCVVSAGNEPPRLEAFDLGSGRALTLLEPNTDLRASLGLKAQWISWPVGKGRRAWGQLLAPSSPKPLPLVINYYDCRGFLKGGTGDLWPFQVLAQSAIAVLCIQQMPAEETGRSDNVAEYKMGLAAIRSAIDHLVGRGLVDRTRVGIGGLSFGSEVAMWTAMNSDVLAAVSIASPTVDPGTYYYFNALPGRDFLKIIESSWGLRHPEKDIEGWKRLSAAMNVGRIDAALLMQMPEQEYRYNVRLFVEMLNSGRAADLYAFPHERHIVAQPRHRLAIYRRNVDWFRFWLQSYEDPDPAKSPQYAHWRALRAQHCRALNNNKSFCV